jgi:hypothetical protein
MDGEKGCWSRMRIGDIPFKALVFGSGAGG